jgi:hypothetical protein
MNHLRQILSRFGQDKALVAAEDAFYFRELTLCLTVASGKRPPLTALPPLLSRLATEPSSARNKLARAAFFVLLSALPNKKARALLAYRMQVGHRSTLGFVRELVAWG